MLIISREKNKIRQVRQPDNKSQSVTNRSELFKYMPINFKIIIFHGVGWCKIIYMFNFDYFIT